MFSEQFTYDTLEEGFFHLEPNWPKVKSLSPRKPKEMPQVLIVDDDPIFCKQLMRAAKNRNVNLSVCHNLSDVLHLSSERKFDVAIIDYYFGAITGLQVLRFLNQTTPVIMVSQTKAEDLTREDWPPLVRNFVHKTKGVQTILDEALFSTKWSNILSTTLSSIENPDFRKKYQLGIAIALIAAVLWTLTFFGHSIYNGSFGRSPELFWDQTIKQVDTV